jgi:methylmalonyl-CoA mutase cobalamin-binding domain/chain
MEVIYSGLQQTPAAIVSGAVQEGAEVIGISCLSGAHLHVAREVMAALAARGISDLPVVMGGITRTTTRRRFTSLAWQPSSPPKTAMWVRLWGGSSRLPKAPPLDRRGARCF